MHARRKGNQCLNVEANDDDDDSNDIIDVYDFYRCKFQQQCDK